MIAWKLWTSVPTVALWEAVALVLEIDPRSLEASPHGWMAGPGRGPFFEPRSFSSKTKRADFDTALSFAERAAMVAGPIYLRTGLAVGMNKRTAQVSLPEVVAFFVSCEWPDIPAPLLALVSAAAEPRYIAGRKLWKLPEAIETVAALPGFGVAPAALLKGAYKAAAAGLLTVRDLEDGEPRKGDNLSEFLGEWVYAEDLNSWLASAGFREPYRLPDVSPSEENQPWPVATAAEPAPEANDAANVEPVARWQAQEQTILNKLRELGHSPDALPKSEAWKPGIKSEVRAAIGSQGMWHSPKVFDKAWERLRERGEITDKP